MDKFAPRDKQGHYLEAYEPVVCTWKKLQIYTNCPGNQSNIWDVYKRNLDAAYDWPPIDEFHFLHTMVSHNIWNLFSFLPTYLCMRPMYEPVLVSIL
jgi:hypothetical protein